MFTDPSSVTTLLVVSEFLLSVIAALIIRYAAKVRIHRQLYKYRQVDLAHVTWFVRNTLHPKLLRHDPYLLLLNILRSLVPVGILVLFVAISESVKTSIDYQQYASVQTIVHAQNDFWDTSGRKPFQSLLHIESALAKGQWRGMPATGYVPVDAQEFARLKWKQRREHKSSFRCKKVQEKKGTYSLSLMSKRIAMYRGNGTINESGEYSLLLPMHTRVREVKSGGSMVVIGGKFVATPFPSRSLYDAEDDQPLNLYEKEQDFARIHSETKRSYHTVVSGAAWKVVLEGHDDVALDGWEYVNALNCGYGMKDRCEKHWENCHKYNEARVIVDFIGMPHGREGTYHYGTKGAFQIAQGVGTRQRFLCEKVIVDATKCKVAPISTTTLIAGIVARKNVTSVNGIMHGVNDEERGATSALSTPLTAEDVETALDLGNHVLIAGSKAAEKRKTVLLAQDTTTFDGLMYVITMVTIAALCVLVIGWEMFARARLGRFIIRTRAPMDPLEVCSTYGVHTAGQQKNAAKQKTPVGPLGFGVVLHDVETSSSEGKENVVVTMASIGKNATGRVANGDF